MKSRFRPSSARAAVTLLLLGTAAGCRRDDRSAEPPPPQGGSLVVAVPSDPGPLLPPLATSPVVDAITWQLFDHLADLPADRNLIGDAGFRPHLADAWSWSPDSLAIAFHIDPRARWHDGTPVRATDVRFTFRAYRDSALGTSWSAALARIDSVTIEDSLTAVVHFARRYPQQFFDATRQMLIMPAHLLERIPPVEWRSSSFAQHPVGSGRFRFAQRTPPPGASVTLQADTANYFGPPHLATLVFEIDPNSDAAERRFLDGDADFVTSLSPADRAELARHGRLRVLTWPSSRIGLLIFNLRSPIFADPVVRRALSMAIDRNATIHDVFGSSVTLATGPLPHSERLGDTTVLPPPFAPDSARALLDSARWVIAPPDGIRYKAGHPLRFTITVPISNSPRLKLAERLRQAFRALGADVQIEPVDFPTYLTILNAGHFDAALITGSSASPATELHIDWGSHALAADGGGNVSGYQNPHFDALIDSATSNTDFVRARQQMRHALQLMLADAPAIWLYEQSNVGGIDRRVHAAPLRADDWWADLADWWIDPTDRLPRDGLRTSRPR
jgi:peptide/nickel transport system substrate-binding protein